MRKKIITMLAATVASGLLCTTLTACSSSANSAANTSSDTGSKSSKKEEKKPIDLSKVTWKVDKGIVDGERRTTISFTNNTDRLLTSVQVDFTRKKGVKDDDWRDAFSWTKDSDLKYTDEKIDEIKGINGWTNLCINPGETKDNIALEMNGFYIQDDRDYDYVEPDILTVEYVNDEDGYLHTAYYDYKKKTQNDESNDEKAFVWPTSDLAKTLPKADSKYVENPVNDANLVAIDVHDYDPDKFNAYVQQLKDAGFTVNAMDEVGSFYNARNSEGTEVIAKYFEEEMDIQLDIPQN